MATTKFVWDELSDNVLMETDENNVPTAEYTHWPERFGELISQERSGVTSYFHYDGAHSTRLLTDDNGEITDTYIYSAYGELVARTGTTTNPFGYKGAVGYYTNAATNDIYVRARSYQPVSGRWLSMDPLGFVDGPNLYCFFAINSVDPSGQNRLYATKRYSRGNDDYHEPNYLTAWLDVSIDVNANCVCGNSTINDYPEYWFGKITVKVCFKATQVKSPKGSDFYEPEDSGGLWIDNGPGWKRIPFSASGFGNNYSICLDFEFPCPDLDITSKHLIGSYLPHLRSIFNPRRYNPFYWETSHQGWQWHNFLELHWTAKVEDGIATVANVWLVAIQQHNNRPGHEVIHLTFSDPGPDVLEEPHAPHKG